MSFIREVKMEVDGHRPSRLIVYIEYLFSTNNPGETLVVQKFPRSKFWLYNGSEYIFDDLLNVVPSNISQEMLYNLDKFRQEP